MQRRTFVPRQSLGLQRELSAKAADLGLAQLSSRQSGAHLLAPGSVVLNPEARVSQCLQGNREKPVSTVVGFALQPITPVLLTREVLVAPGTHWLV